MDSCIIAYIDDCESVWGVVIKWPSVTQATSHETWVFTNPLVLWPQHVGEVQLDVESSFPAFWVAHRGVESTGLTQSSFGRVQRPNLRIALARPILMLLIWDFDTRNYSRMVKKNVLSWVLRYAELNDLQSFLARREVFLRRLDLPRRPLLNCPKAWF